MSENTGSAKARKQEESGESKTRRGKTNRTSQSTEASLNMQELRELAALVNEHGFTDFEFENENIRIRLSKMTASPIVQAVQSLPTVPNVSAAPQSPTAAETNVEAMEKSGAADEGLYKITSPIVGTFYRAPSPDKEPYVKEGSKVSPESTVCIVEAMKLMNEIQSEISGEVVKIYVENGQPVEYGQPLFGIKQ